MLDYVIKCYRVEYQLAGEICTRIHNFDTEEEAISFIKERPESWVDWCLEKVLVAETDI